MTLTNPYLSFFLSLPPSFWRHPWVPLDDRELSSPDWLRLKSAITSHFSWAVPTQEAIECIRKYTGRVIEIGCGSGYWAWLMNQAGIDVLALDTAVPSFAWHEIHLGNELEALRHPDRTLFLCWPPWGSEMAVRALTCYAGDHVIYVGEWMGGCANALFFAALTSWFEAVETVALPQWFMRSDNLTVFRRRVGTSPLPRSPEGTTEARHA
jgi:hypothetical protein